MHIPDGFLTTPVWAAFDVASLPAVALISRGASRVHNSVDDKDDGRRIPLLGVMGAFVFAAQMINFPVGLGTSGHLVGGALLAIVLGPWPAALVMTAILAIQAFVFQDGGILALGANIFNMAVAGVFAGYLPYALGRRRFPSVAIFLAGTLSVLVSATLALSELRLSGIKIDHRLLIVSMIVFAGSAVLEGVITLAAVRAIERISPVLSAPKRAASPMLVIGAIFLIALAVGAVLLASKSPDGVEHILSTQAIAEPQWMRALMSAGGILGAYILCAAAAKLIAIPALDARAKLGALLVFLIAVSTTRPGAHVGYALYATIVIAAASVARLPLGKLLRRSAIVLPFVATFAAITWWSGDHARALALAEKSLLCGFAAILLIATTPIYDLLHALESLGAPRPLTLVIQFLHRYLFVISEQSQRMRHAAQSRQGTRGNRRILFAGVAGALGVLFARSWERADGIYRAMLARGFTGHFPTSAPRRFRAPDAMFLFFAASISAAVRMSQ